MNRIKHSNLLLAENLINQIMSEFEARGLAVAIIDKKGKTQYENYFGYSDLETKSQINEDTIFGLASVTKSFTALSIMQLEESGLLSIQDPVSKYIPDFTDLSSTPITIGHFLSHSGGYFPLPRILVNDVAEKLGLDETICGDLAYNSLVAEEGTREVASRLNAQTIKNGGRNGVPGECFSYCNDGFGLLSEIIRRVGPEPSYAEYVNQHILKPLHMDRSFCDFLRPARDSNSATLYKKTGGVMTGSRDYHENAFVLNGGGAMKSTLGDLKKYLTLYLNEGKSKEGVRLLSEYRIREMGKPRQPYLADGYYGYGLYSMQLDDLKITGHGGSLPGVSSHIAWSLEAEAGIILLCNTSGVPVNEISNALFRVYNGKSPINSRERYQETLWSKETIEEAVGTYISGEGTKIEIRKQEDGTLGLLENEISKPFIPVNSLSGFVRSSFTDTYLHLHKKENQGIYAITFGSRMIPKE